MKKRLLSVFLALTMLFSLVVVPANAASAPTLTLSLVTFAEDGSTITETGDVSSAVEAGDKVALKLLFENHTDADMYLTNLDLFISFNEKAVKPYSFEYEDPDMGDLYSIGPVVYSAECKNFSKEGNVSGNVAMLSAATSTPLRVTAAGSEKWTTRTIAYILFEVIENATTGSYEFAFTGADNEMKSVANKDDTDATVIEGLVYTSTATLPVDGIAPPHTHELGALIPQKDAVHTADKLEAGMKAHYKCSCGAFFDENQNETTEAALVIAAPTHNYNTVNGYRGADGHANTCSCGAHDTVVPHTPGAAATEETPQTCTVCNYVIVGALGHQCKNHLTPVEAKAATCTEDGNIAYYECSCGKYYEDDAATKEITDKASVKIPAGHEYGELIPQVDAVHKANELKAGMKAHYKCSCGAFFDEKKNETTEAALVIAAPTHNYNTVNGYKGADGHANTCSCGAHDTVVPHTPGAAATEENPQTCTVCGYVIAPVLPHECKNLTHVAAKEKTCTDDGNIEYYECNKCGKYYEDAEAETEITDKDSVKIPAGHEYGELIETKKAIHTKDELAAGMKAHYICGKCGGYFDADQNAIDEEDLIIPKPEHEYENENGYKEADGHANTCSCGAHDTVVPHTPGAAATEEDDQICTVCEYVIKPALGHLCENHLTHVEAKEETCTEDGNIEYYECSCGKYYEDEAATKQITDKDSVKIEAPGHEYGTLVAEKKAIHTKDELAAGMKAHYYCDECDTYFDADQKETTEAALIIPKPSHEYGEWIKTDEKHWHECGCGAKSDEGDHEWKEATCDDPKTCSVCGATSGEPKGHTEGDEWKYNSNYHWHICTVEGCGAVIQDSKAAHEFGIDTKCDICGYVQPVYDDDDDDRAPVTYKISIEDSKNGEVTSNRKSASKGTDITLTVEPDEGYELESLKVYDKDGDKVKVKAGKKEGKYTFEMPASKVTVEATFVKVEAEIEMNFYDVDEEAYYFDAVEWAVENGVTTGYADGSFLPNNTCTRAQTVTFLWRAMGCPAPEISAMPFTDVDEEAYYYDAVLWAVQNGITTGTSATTFSPNKTVSRAQTVTFLWRTAVIYGYDVSVGLETNILSYADAQTIPAYAVSALQWACGDAILGGYADGTLRPHAGCTRAHIVTFLYRFLAD